MSSTRGFTLLELLLVMALTLIMLAVMLSRTNGLSSSAEVDRAAQEVITLFRELRQKSVSIKVIDTGSQLEYPAYGAVFSPGSGTFTVFVDCDADDNNDGKLDNADTWNQLDCGSASVADLNLTLSNSVRVTGITIYPSQGAGAISNPTNVAVQFLRPEPTLWITHVVAGSPTVTSSATVDVTLTDRRGTDTATVRIEGSGLIYKR